MDLQLHKPSRLIPCEINLPGSKSISNRVLIIKAIAGLDFFIQNLSDSDDTRHLQSALEFYKTTSLINVGHAGTDMRFLTAFLSLQNGSYELTGSERLQQRPVKDLVEVLKKLGADITYKKTEGFPPLLINGKHFMGGRVGISGGVSSQFITALLLVAPYFTNGLELTITGELVSKPYVNLTVGIMKEFGAKVVWSDNTITVAPIPYTYRKKAYEIESDWSAASYHYSLVALSGENTQLTLTGLYERSFQADYVCAQIFQSFGVSTKFLPEKIVVTKSVKPNSTDILNLNLIECPDIAQTLVCTCIGSGMPFKFSGLQTLKLKETDRLLALQQELKKFGYLVDITESSIQWTGNKIPEYNKLSVSTYHDHRMAMSFAPLCLQYDQIIIEDAEVVSKSYPLFWEHLKQTGIDQIKL